MKNVIRAIIIWSSLIPFIPVIVYYLIKSKIIAGYIDYDYVIYSCKWFTTPMDNMLYKLCKLLHLV